MSMLKEMISINKFILHMYLLSFVAVLIGCSNEGKTPHYTALSESEVEEFLKGETFEPLAIEDMREWTVILYGHGIFYLANKKDERILNQVGWGGGEPSDVQVGLVSTGIPHAYIIINDNRLFKEASKVQVSFSDGTIATKEVKSKGLLFFYDKSKRNLTIDHELELSILTDDGEILYEEKI